MRTETQNVDDYLDALQMTLDSVRSKLEGDTATNYDIAMAKWRGHVDDMKFLLNQADLTLRKISEDYATTDRTEGGLWAALQ
jgi:WXG100 family type VII secretion target